MIAFSCNNYLCTPGGSCSEKINYPRTILSYLRDINHCPRIIFSYLHDVKYCPRIILSYLRDVKYCPSVI